MNLVKVSEAAKRLGISVETARRKIKLHQWHALKLGPKTTLVDIDEILDRAKEVPDPRPKEREKLAI